MTTVMPPLAVGAAVEPMIRVHDLNHYFGTGDNRKQVLCENRLTLNPGEMVVMTGPSGSGKTTLLTLIGGIRSVQEGSAQVLGRELLGLSARRLMEHRREIGFIFQAHNLFESLTAVQNVRMALEVSRLGRGLDEAAVDILNKLGLGQRLYHKPHALSGGQRQRVAVGRALVNRPRLILADEPTAALDKQSGRDVINLLKELTQTNGSTVLLVTHDSRILDVADRIVNMVDGRIVSEFLAEPPAAAEAFLRRCSALRPQPPAVLSALARRMAKERYHAGSAIIREGDEGQNFYLIREGEAVARRPRGGGPIPLRPGDAFGAAALGAGGGGVTVSARHDTVVYRLAKVDLMTALEGNPTLRRQLLSLLRPPALASAAA
jgi:putative ABC transport system ATP-binding protein